MKSVARVWIGPGMITNPSCGQLKRETFKVWIDHGMVANGA